MTTRMMQRRGLASQWTAIDPILEIGEFGFEEDTQKFKVGDGETSWTNLPYFINEALLPDVPALLAAANEQVQTAIASSVSTAVAGIVDSAPSVMDTLNEISAALADDPNFAATMTNELANKADVVHTHVKSDITDFSHTHPITDLSSFSVSSPSTGEVLTYNGITWSNSPIPQTDLGEYPTLTSTSTLTNKTLTAPVINEAAINASSINSSTILSPIESFVYVAAAPAATNNIDAQSGTVVMFDSNMTTNASVNIRWTPAKTLQSILSSGNTITLSIIVKNAATTYYLNTFQIDGVTITPKWINSNTPSSGTQNTTEIYTYSISRAGASWVVLASKAYFS